MGDQVKPVGPVCAFVALPAEALGRKVVIVVVRQGVEAAVPPMARSGSARSGNGE